MNSILEPALCITLMLKRTPAEGHPASTQTLCQKIDNDISLNFLVPPGISLYAHARVARVMGRAPAGAGRAHFRGVQRSSYWALFRVILVWRGASSSVSLSDMDQQTCSRFSYLLKPITKNWEVDVAGQLDDYLCEVSSSTPAQW